MQTSSVGITPLKLGMLSVLCKHPEICIKKSKALYPLLERGLDLHTWGEKMLFQNLNKTLHKSESILLQYSGAALVRDTDSKTAQLTAAMRDQVRRTFYVQSCET